jgi:hypothetical protein
MQCNDSSPVQPHPRFGHTMVATKRLGRIALFGGSDGRARLSDGQLLQVRGLYGGTGCT